MSDSDKSVPKPSSDKRTVGDLKEGKVPSTRDFTIGKKSDHRGMAADGGDLRKPKPTVSKPVNDE